MFILAHTRMTSVVYVLSSGERVWNVKLHDRVESSACVSDDGQWLIVGEWIAGGGY